MVEDIPDINYYFVQECSAVYSTGVDCYMLQVWDTGLLRCMWALLE